MSGVTAIFLCIQAFLLQNALTAPTCLQLGNGLSLPNNLQMSGQNYGNLQGKLQGLSSNLIEPCNQVLTEYVAPLQCGDMSVTGDLPVGGSIKVSGCIPVYGIVTVDGAVPSQGTAVVNHSCGPC